MYPAPKSSVPTTRSQAQAWDDQDPFLPLRAQFLIDPDVTYMVGHSLGPVSIPAKASLARAEAAWESDIVGAWNSAGWIDLAVSVGGKIAAMIGAEPHDVVVCDSVSVNLFKLAGAAVQCLGLPRRIIIEEDEFPTDLYIAAGLADLSGAELIKVAPGQGVDTVRSGGVLIKSAVHYRTAAIADMAGNEAALDNSKAQIVWDFSHATGIVPLDVGASDVKLGAGCTYKYLNGGPGAPSFVYARADIAARLISPLPGWLGHASPFAFTPDYVPAPHAARFTAGTPPILSLAALDGALDLYGGIDLKAAFCKTQILSKLVVTRAERMGLTSRGPVNSNARGGHICLVHHHGYPVVQALSARGIKTDFRTPDVIRFGLSPLYLSCTQVWDVMETLEEILSGKLWDTPEFRTRAKVT